jgi:type II secretory pathway component PulK
MDSNAFNIAQTKGKPKTTKTADAIDVAARYFVYKLYEATDGQSMQWRLLHGMGESAATVARAVERGWVHLQCVAGKPLERKAALTDEGRRLARKGR